MMETEPNHWHVSHVRNEVLLMDIRMTDIMSSIDTFLGYTRSWSATIPDPEYARKQMVLQSMNPYSIGRVDADPDIFIWFPCIRCTAPLEN